MNVDESLLASLPLKTKRLVLRALAEAAAHGVVLQIATDENRQRLMTRERVRRFRERQRGVTNSVTGNVASVTSNVTERYEPPAETPKNPAISQVIADAPASRARASQISDLSEIREEDQRESAREAPKPKARAKTPNALAWRRVPPTWVPNDQHRAIASECCVPFELELAKFRDHEFSAPKRDPDATFRNWLRSARRPGPAPFSAAPLPPAPRIKYSTPAEIYRALGREA